MKPSYFDSEKFITAVLKAMKLDTAPAPTVLALREEIENLLTARIVGTVIDGMGKKEIEMYNNILNDHPEIDEMDALMMLAPSIEGLKEKMERNLNSLYSELVYDADQIEKRLTKKA
jgi:hypothetical protein